MVSCIPVELGVCHCSRASREEAGKWSYFTVPVPASTPADQLEEVATREFLSKHEDIFVHHTWIQSVGTKVNLEVVENDTELLESIMRR